LSWLAGGRTRRASANGSSFTTGDLRELPFADGSFDVVLAPEVLEHVREQGKALAELTRMLRPGGTLVVSSPGALDSLPTRRRIGLRKARTPEEAGVEIAQLGTNDVLEQADIAHEPYFHDAFTLPGLRALLPSDLEPRRLCSLLLVPPRLLSYSFLVVEAFARRLPGRRSGPRPADGEIVEVPEPYAEAQALMAWTRLLWRIPVLREAGGGVVLVGRCRQSSLRTTATR
jgi:SAM-dependent methyltransferase